MRIHNPSVTGSLLISGSITSTDDIESLFVHNPHGGDALDLELFIATS